VADWRTYLRHLDYLLLLATAGLIVYGVTMIYFATRHDYADAPLYFVRQQLIAVVVGVVAAVVVSLLDYEVYRRFQWILYGTAVILVAAVLPFPGSGRHWAVPCRVHPRSGPSGRRAGGDIKDRRSPYVSGDRRSWSNRERPGSRVPAIYPALRITASKW